MPLNLAIAVAVTFIILMIMIIRNIKRNKLQLSYSIFWILAGIMLIVVLLIPNCLNYLTKLLGFEVTSNMIFFITIVIIFYLILELMIALSKETKRNVALIQEISILKEKIKRIEEEIRKKE